MLKILNDFKNKHLKDKNDFYSDKNRNKIGLDDIYIYLINLKENNKLYGKCSEKFK